MNPINQSCLGTVKNFNRFSVEHAPKDYKINGYFQTGDYAQRGTGQTASLANNDNVNAGQTNAMYAKNMPRQSNMFVGGNWSDYGNAYGNMSWQYINQDTYNGKFDEIRDVERVHNSADVEYVIPDRSQYPKYQWQNNYSAWRPFTHSMLYEEKGKVELSKIQKTKNTKYAQKYRS